MRQVYLATRHALLFPLAVTRRHACIPRTIRKILVVRTDRIGDLVLSTPFLRNLREHFPAAEIVLLARAFACDILYGGTLVDRILALDEKPALSIKQQALAAEAFDLAIDLHYDYPLETALIVRRARPACSVGFDIGGRGVLFDIPVPAKEKKHFIDETFDILRAIGLHPHRYSPEISISPEASATAHEILSRGGANQPFAVFHPGGFYPEQRWPADRFAQLADLTAALGLAPVLIGGPVDAACLTKIARRMTTRTICISGEGIAVSTAIIGCAALFVGNNSGPLHIACAMRIPSISTMGPTDPVRFWPVFKHAHVVRANKVQQISVEEMYAVVRKILLSDIHTD